MTEYPFEIDRAQLDRLFFGDGTWVIPNSNVIITNAQFWCRSKTELPNENDPTRPIKASKFTFFADLRIKGKTYRSKVSLITTDLKTFKGSALEQSEEEYQRLKETF